jgi:hypothetical protein
MRAPKRGAADVDENRGVRQWFREGPPQFPLRWPPAAETRADDHAQHEEAVKVAQAEADKREANGSAPVACTEAEPYSCACSPPDRVGQNRSTNPPTPRRETSRVSERAQRLLRAHLASGPKRGELIEAAAEAAGIPESSLIKAADVLGVRTQRGQWWLPG